MRNRTHTGALAAATLALAVSSAATAADDFRGIWRNTWPNGNTTELTIVDIDDQGRAIGTYCHLTDRNHHRRFFFDMHPDAITARVEDGVLRIEHAKAHWAFRVDPANPNIMRMAFRLKKTVEIDLDRVETQSCAARLVQLTPPANATTPQSVADRMLDDPDQWAVGSWVGTRHTGLIIELNVLDVVDGHARGIYCNERPGPSFAARDLHPEGINARVTRNKLSFRIRDIQFSFKRTDDDTLGRTSSS